MMKIFTLLTILTCFYSASFAQNNIPVKGDGEFGVDFGYNGSYITEGNSNQTSNSKSGFNFGVSRDQYFSDRWSLKVKLIYDQKGWNEAVSLDDYTRSSVNFNVDYLTLPVMANWHFGRKRNWYLDFGPYIGFLLSAKENSYDVKNEFNSVDGGIALGIGVKIPISNRAKFFIEYDGQGGAANIASFDDGYRYQNVRESFNIGILF